MVAAAVPPLVVVQNLKMIGQRRQGRLQVDVVRARPAMNGHEGRPFDHRVSAGNGGWSGNVEPQTHVA
jgi:hypothetical protein